MAERRVQCAVQESCPVVARLREALYRARQDLEVTSAASQRVYAQPRPRPYTSESVSAPPPDTSAAATLDRLTWEATTEQLRVRELTVREFAVDLWPEVRPLFGPLYAGLTPASMPKPPTPPAPIQTHPNRRERRQRRPR